MNTDDFWSLIERARQDAAPQSESAMLVALFRQLVKLPDNQIFDWYQLQCAYIDLADTPKLFAAAVVINDGSSDDRFYYFRSWLVMQGRTVYEAALTNPDSLAEIDFCFGEAEWEMCASIAPLAFTGKCYLHLFEENSPAEGAIRRRYPDRADLKKEIEDTVMRYILRYSAKPRREKVDLETQLLRDEVVAYIKNVNPTADFYGYLLLVGKERCPADLLTKHLVPDRDGEDPFSRRTLPALWKKRTDWKAGRLQRQSGTARHNQAER